MKDETFEYDIAFVINSTGFQAVKAGCQMDISIFFASVRCW